MAFLLWGDIPSIARFALGGVGAGTELIASVAHPASSLAASALLNTQLRAAIVDAESVAPICNNNIYVDLIGHSRGGPMITSALRMGFGPRANYNLSISTTLLDAADPSIGDQLRPWTRAANAVNDPLILRVGNEWNSSFYGSDSSGEVNWGLEDFISIVIWPPYGGITAEFIRADVVGLPKGRDRSLELEDPAVTFGAYQGPLTGIRHKEFAGDPTEVSAGTTNEMGLGMMWVDPTNSNVNNLNAPVASVGASLFAFASTSHLGTFLGDARGFSTTGAVGFHASSSFTTTDEASCIPVSCGGPGTCSNDFQNGTQPTALDNDGMAVRELVPDFDFRTASGIVSNSKELILKYPNLKTIIGNDELGSVRTFIENTAAANWVVDGTWKRSGSGSAGIYLAATAETVAASSTPYLLDPAVNTAAMTTIAQQQAQVNLWQQQLDAMSDADTAARIATLTDAAAKTTSATSAYVQFPTATSNKIFTTLLPPSLAADELLVRIEYDLGTTSTAKLSLALNGPGLSSSATWLPAAGTNRRVAEVIVYRSVAATTGADRIFIEGQDVAVFAVSVRPSLPIASTVTNSAFEFVMLERGVSRERAADLASRSIWQGKSGRLARITATNQLAELNAVVAPDGRAWIDGRSSNGAPGSFKTSNGVAIASSLFAPGTSFTVLRPRGAQVYTWPASANTRLGHADPGTAIGNDRVGFWIEYVGAGASSAAAAPAPSMMEAVESSESSVAVEGESETVSEELPQPAGPPSCLSMESLVCAPE